MEEIKVFGKWSSKGIEVKDLSLHKYLSLEPKHIMHSFGRSTKRRFEKAEMPVVERLINKLMRSGQGKRKMSGKYIRGKNATGKKLKMMKSVENAFEIIEKETKENPIQVLVRAIEHSAPREDTTRVKKGGVAYTLAVDVAPLKRMDESLKNLALAAFASSFKSRENLAKALSKEIIAASKEESQSYAVKRKNEIERIAASSR